MVKEININEENTIKPDPTEDIPETRPRIFFKNITLNKSGQPFNFGNNDIVVFVGGNNAGKSQVLRDLEGYISNITPNKIISDVELQTIGSSEAVKELIQKNPHYIEKNGETLMKVIHSRYSYPKDRLYSALMSEWRDKNFRSLHSIFCHRIKTETRITESNPAPSFNRRKESPSEPIQFLYSNSPAEKRISSYFREAFNKDLIVDKGGGSKIPLLAGQYQKPINNEDRTDSEYIKRLDKEAAPLEEQGDGMRSFASVILQTLADPVPSILLLDEPEAFLHPPQAKTLGRLLAKERPRDAQLFIATHSVDILMGLLEAAPENLHIIHLNRESDEYAVELDKDKAKEIIHNPLLRYSNVLSGVFYKRVILCEDSSDCLFYQALLGAMDKSVSDALFLHTSGKDRLHQLAEILKTLGVPVSVIVDIDILQDGSNGTFENIINALKGNWESINKNWRPLKQNIEQKKPKSGKETKTKLQTILDGLPDDLAGSILEEIKTLIEDSLNESSPWTKLKKAGQSDIPSGESTQQWKEIQQLCAKAGLWIVSVGEIEGFYRMSGKHGPKWVQTVLELGTEMLKKDKNLREAREFISAVWNNKPEDLS